MAGEGCRSWRGEGPGRVEFVSGKREREREREKAEKRKKKKNKKKGVSGGICIELLFCRRMEI